MCLQIDKEFNQHKIEQLNKKFDVEMYHTELCGGKLLLQNRKIRKFKKILLRSKRFEKKKDKT